MRCCASIYLGREERCLVHQVGLIHNVHVHYTETLIVQEMLSYKDIKAILLQWFNKLASSGEILRGKQLSPLECC